MKVSKLLLSLILIFFSMTCNAQVLRKRTTTLMGSHFDITIVAKDSLSAEQNIDRVIAEITRIENLISEWKPDTQISEVNRNAGIQPVKVDREIFELTKRAIWFSTLTDGAFDISIAAMDRIWKFDGTMTEKPSDEQIRKSIEKVGYKNIILDSINTTIFLKNAGMKIGFGATGKGYAADKGKELMKNLDVEAGIVNASGDMAVWGTQPDGKAWIVGITNPFHTDSTVKVLLLKDEAVVTSGDYQKFVELEGKRFSHIINPKTGYPTAGITSVTVKGPDAEIANGISTSIMVLGKNKGIALLKNFPGYHCFIVQNNGKVIVGKGFK